MRIAFIWTHAAMLTVILHDSVPVPDDLNGYRLRKRAHKRKKEDARALITHPQHRRRRTSLGD